jgi:MraZ protein
LNPLSQEARRLSRFFNAGSFDGELDSAGRVGVPGPLLTYAGLTKEVIVVGNDDHLELWDPQQWSTYEADLMANVSDTVERIVNPA